MDAKKSLALRHKTKTTQSSYRMYHSALPNLSTEYSIEKVRKEFKKMANYQTIDKSHIILENLEETVSKL